MPYRFGNPYTLALLLAALFTFGLAAATLDRWDEQGSRPLFGFLVAIGLWALGDAVRIAAPTEAAVLLWNRVAYAGIVFVPPTLLAFALSYTGRRRWLRRRYLAALLSVSLLALAVVLTNPLHGLWLEVESISPGTAPPVLSEAWGPVWYLWAAYVYAVVLAVTYLFARQFLTARRSSPLRRQTGLVLGGILVAVVTNVAFIAGAVPFDPTPFVFALTGLSFGVALFRYRLLTLLPVARDTVFETMDSGVVVLDADDQVVDVNQRAAEMFGLDGPSAIGAPASAAFAEFPAVRERLRSGTDGGSDPVAVGADGRTRHYDLETSRMHDAVGAYVGRVVVASDVTRRVARREQLRERTARLERTNERLDEFATVVSHDLRNPLNVVVGHVELARAADDPEPHLDSIADAAGRMEALTDDLLALARHGDAIGRREPVALERVAGAAWDVVEGDAATITVETGDARVAADADRLQEAFENLFRNALDHAGEDAHVRVGTLRNDGGGPGIPAEERDRVFESGYSTAEDGTGFGLAIVREIVEAHGWSVRVTDGDAGGARFEITGVEFVD